MALISLGLMVLSKNLVQVVLTLMCEVPSRGPTANPVKRGTIAPRVRRKWWPVLSAFTAQTALLNRFPATRGLSANNSF